MDITSFIKSFENAFENIPANSIKADTEFRALEQWDSLTALNVLAILDMEYGVQINRNEMTSCKTVQNLFDLVQTKKK